MSITHLDLILFAITLGFLALFLILYYINPYRIINGFLLDCFLAGFVASSFVFLGIHRNPISNVLMWMTIVVIALIAFFGIYILMGYLFINSVKMFKKERWTFAHSLSLILLIGMVAQLVTTLFFMKYITNTALLGIFSLLNSIEAYLVLVAISYVTISVVILLNRRRKPCDYFIVLGCWLMNGNRISPMLAGRVDKAIAAYNKQKQAGKKAKILLSGGKGSDEKLAEAEAMQQYAIAHGVPVEDTIVENQSVNTWENMRFSKQKMDALSPNGYSCAFVTSDYHVFRAGIYAKKAGLRHTKGIGSKTKGYYFPNAMIREYIALLVMNKKKNFFAVLLIFAVYMLGLVMFLMHMK